MTYDSLKEDLSHVNVVTTTPFDADTGEVLTDQIKSNVEALLDAGVRAYIPCGGAGEIAALTATERVKVVRTTVEAVGDSGSVVGGVAGSLADARELIGRYADAGADGVMLRTPAQRGQHQQGLLEYYHTLADSTDLGVMLYRDPPVATEKMIAECADLDNVVAVKYKGDLEDFVRSRRRLDDAVVEDLVWLCGNGAELAFPPFAWEGADGYTSGLANFVPEAAVTLVDHVRAEEWSEARHVRETVRPYQELGYEAGADNELSGANSIPAIKYGQELAALYGGPARPPLAEGLSDADKNRAEKYFARIEAELLE